MVSPLSAFSVEALGCLSSFSGAYHDSEICVGGHWGKLHCFSLAIRQHLSIRYNLAPKVLASSSCSKSLSDGFRSTLVDMDLYQWEAWLMCWVPTRQLTVDGSEIQRSKNQFSGTVIWHPSLFTAPGFYLPPSNRWVSLGICEACWSPWWGWHPYHGTLVNF